MSPARVVRIKDDFQALSLSLHQLPYSYGTSPPNSLSDDSSSTLKDDPTNTRMQSSSISSSTVGSRSSNTLRGSSPGTPPVKPSPDMDHERETPARLINSNDTWSASSIPVAGEPELATYLVDDDDDFAHLPANARKSAFKKELMFRVQQMMFVSGETGDPSPETTGMIEEIVRQQVVEIVSRLH
jgi:hypothetical protein